MNWQDYEVEGQMSIFDLDSCSGKTLSEHSVPTKDKIFEPYLKKQRKSLTRPPLFLDLRKENGIQRDASWQMGGPLPGEFSMLNFGESPKDVDESLLSQILQDNVPEKYYLSEKACQGILRRAEKRGKQLPEILRKALMHQANIA